MSIRFASIALAVSTSFIVLAAACSVVNDPVDPADGGAGGGLVGGAGGAGLSAGGDPGGGGTGGSGGQADPCPGETLCDAVCVDTTSNAEHCGDCNVPCGVDEECVDSDCACVDILVMCVDACIDPFNDPTFCGATGDCQGPNAGLACGIDSPPGDQCVDATCVGDRELISNGDFSADLADWTTENNPVNANDTTSTFFVNANLQCENEGSSGPSARVVMQDFVVPAVVLDAHFSLSFAQTNGQPLNPQDALVIEKDQNGNPPVNAFRIDIIDPAEDPFYAPILLELYAPDQAVGDAANLVPIADPAPGLLAFLQANVGQPLRLRIGQIESSFPWQVYIDDVSLAVVGGD